MASRAPVLSFFATWKNTYLEQGFSSNRMKQLELAQWAGGDVCKPGETSWSLRSTNASTDLRLLGILLVGERRRTGGYLDVHFHPCLSESEIPHHVQSEVLLLPPHDAVTHAETCTKREENNQIKERTLECISYIRMREMSFFVKNLEVEAKTSYAMFRLACSAIPYVVSKTKTPRFQLQSSSERRGNSTTEMSSSRRELALGSEALHSS
ncbi:hypothetical protein AVEN_159626-1 [Araneus ventricosus]|uniref:Uncharacterized protein n=1 Tax=Araneus ventricosus TaxID=182803 RepID=A0A4Y2S8I2_ARAVE|nr:hypothetical protein AVEN_159626-1 [Araneus ventricosus]